MTQTSMPIKKQITERTEPKKLPHPSTTHQRVLQLLTDLQKHPSAVIFNQPLDPKHPKFHDVRHEFTTLSYIELQFKLGTKFSDTISLARKIRKMIMV